MRTINFPARFGFDQGQAIRRVAVDFIRRSKNKRRVRAKSPGRFEQNQSSVRVNGKIRKRFFRRPIVRRLRRRVNDDFDVFSVLLKVFD